MFNPSDQEGEVDHSFFDSDCDDGSLRRDGGEMVETGLKDEKDSLLAHERLAAKEIEDTKSGCSPRIEETTNDNISSAKAEENNWTRVDSAGSRHVAAGHPEESDDTVTDVSRLSSPDSSLLRCLDPKHSEDEEGSLEEQPKESVPSGGPSNAHGAEDSDHDVDACSLSSESQLGVELIYRPSGGRSRKNYSLSNDEVQPIDHENQRLLGALSRPSAKSSPGGTMGGKASNSPIVRLSYRALNRQREQRRIEKDNLRILKRLESIEPTDGLKCSEQLADYQRMRSYVTPPSSICRTPSERPGLSPQQMGCNGSIKAAGHHNGSYLILTDQVPGHSVLPATPPEAFPPPLTPAGHPGPKT